ncbi:uncharacterized protein AMSG_07205 [Thecamonas trahens ATCC 50062]|uniref:Uncharacterized protein n=1 Tax=Thecamonas trahens ATCC 50062 TaxID=461836 RepID=A0A0L0DI30_THETB|nr:hypothetical protein AMSG_07205 [Thecamonas trahens ATCC 50062]KNC50953.1 hypothetical protein AMSG_07205 [Thecamonas trahens ATCC 50062]|eukprot:XP_013756649.1 hypothetical protein AMSG_07205 [Thecamonas trahens ATCC 50062]
MAGGTVGAVAVVDNVVKLTGSADVVIIIIIIFIDDERLAKISPSFSRSSHLSLASALQRSPSRVLVSQMAEWAIEIESLVRRSLNKSLESLTGELSPLLRQVSETGWSPDSLAPGPFFHKESSSSLALGGVSSIFGGSSNGDLRDVFPPMPNSEDLATSTSALFVAAVFVRLYDVTSGSAAIGSLLDKLPLSAVLAVISSSPNALADIAPETFPHRQEGLFGVPYTKPSSHMSKWFVGRLAHVPSRSDAYSQSLGMIFVLFKGCFASHAILHSRSASPAVDEQAAGDHTAELASKIRWLVTTIKNAIRLYPPSPFLIRSLLTSTDRILSLAPLLGHAGGGLLDSITLLKEVFTQVLAKTESNLERCAGLGVGSGGAGDAGGGGGSVANTSLFSPKRGSLGFGPEPGSRDRIAFPLSPHSNKISPSVDPGVVALPPMPVNAGLAPAAASTTPAPALAAPPASRQAFPAPTSPRGRPRSSSLHPHELAALPSDILGTASGFSSAVQALTAHHETNRQPDLSSHASLLESFISAGDIERAISPTALGSLGSGGTASLPGTSTEPVSDSLWSTTVVGSVAGIEVQYDPDVLRVHLPGTSESFDSIEHVYCSTSAGTLLLTRSELAWTPTVYSPNDRRRVELLVPLRLNYTAVTKYTTGVLKLPSTFYLAVFTQNAVYKLYPFSLDEAAELVEGLAHFTGLAPFSHTEHIKMVLSRKLHEARDVILQELLAEPESPWIILTPVLHKVVRSLLSGLNVYDMERLFHSCRLNREAAKETFNTLRKAWRDTSSDSVHLRILAVVDRLIDPAVMPPDSSLFRDVRKWLNTIQKRLDPFKHQQATEIVHKLLTQASFVASRSITPIAPFRCPIVFDYWAEYLSLTTSHDPLALFHELGHM